MSYIPDDNTARKMLPLFRYVTEYCPKALREACKVSVVNNVRYNPDRDPADINWERSKSTDQLGSAFRHMMERQVGGKVFEDVPEDIAKKTGIARVYVLAEAYWRIGAALELEIEKQEATDKPSYQNPSLYHEIMNWKSGVNGADTLRQEQAKALAYQQQTYQQQTYQQQTYQQGADAVEPSIASQEIAKPSIGLWGTPGDKGHRWGGLSDKRKCLKCNSLHNLSKDQYVKGFFDRD